MDKVKMTIIATVCAVAGVVTNSGIDAETNSGKDSSLSNPPGADASGTGDLLPGNGAGNRGGLSTVQP